MLSKDGRADYPLDLVFVPTDVHSVSEVVKRIEAGRYVMDPDFQRDFVWPEDKQRSRTGQRMDGEENMDGEGNNDVGVCAHAVGCHARALPGIHWAKPQAWPYVRLDWWDGLMDGRVEPGHD